MHAPETTLILVRHAHVSEQDCGPRSLLCGWHDPPLSRLGREQVQRVCARLGRWPRPHAIYASPLRRAWHTAAPIGEQFGIPVWPDDALREISCGELDGMPLEVVARDHADLWRRNLAQDDQDFRWPGGESYRDLRVRALGVMHRIAAAHSGARVVIVTHTGIISQAFGSHAGIDAARWEAFRPGYASLSAMSVRGRQLTPLCFDSRDHR